MRTWTANEAKINPIPVTSIKGMKASAENIGRWTEEEHSLFLKGLELYGKGWKKIAELIKTRTVVQVRTHAQKYFLKHVKDNPSIVCSGISSVKISQKFRGSTVQAVEKKPTKLLGRCKRKRGSGRKASRKTGKNGIPLSAGTVNKVPCLPGELSPSTFLLDNEKYNLLPSPQGFPSPGLSTQELKEDGSFYPRRSLLAQLRHYSFNMPSGPEKGSSPIMPVSDIHVSSPRLAIISLTDPEGRRFGSTREHPVPCTFDWTGVTCDEQIPNSVNPANHIEGNSSSCCCFMQHSKSLAPSYSTSECIPLDEISIPFDVPEEGLSSSDCGSKSYHSRTDTEGTSETKACVRDELYSFEHPFFPDLTTEIAPIMNSQGHSGSNFSSNDLDILEVVL